jgi:NADPH:quinone reductase-like Zn-dependent oxidoreductase
VTGVCSAANLDLVRSLGAADVVDYTRHDFTAQGRVYDVVFDAVAKFPAAQARKIVAAHRYVDTGRKRGNVVILMNGDGVK